VVGHDWGGVVAWWLALRNPGLVERLAVLNAPHPGALVEGKWADPRQLVRSWYVLAFQLPRLPQAGLRAVGGQGAGQTSRPGTFPDEDLARSPASGAQPGALPAMLNWYRAALRARPRGLPAPRVRVPTLILWGTGDKVLRRELANDALSRCDQGRLELL